MLVLARDMDLWTHDRWAEWFGVSVVEMLSWEMGGDPYDMGNSE